MQAIKTSSTFNYFIKNFSSSFEIHRYTYRILCTYGNYIYNLNILYKKHYVKLYIYTLYNNNKNVYRNLSVNYALLFIYSMHKHTLDIYWVMIFYTHLCIRLKRVLKYN